jgi:hypothetical protein
MKLQRKLDILNAMAGDMPRFPVDRVYRDGNRILASNGWQIVAFDLDEQEAATSEVANLDTLDAGATSSRATKESPKTAARIREWLSEPKDAVAIDSASLWAFLKVGDYRKCVCCGGSGERPPDFDPAELSGDPFERSRPVLIADVCVNANLLVSARSRCWIFDSACCSRTNWPPRWGSLKPTSSPVIEGRR